MLRRLWCCLVVFGCCWFSPPPVMSGATSPAPTAGAALPAALSRYLAAAVGHGLPHPPRSAVAPRTAQSAPLARVISRNPGSGVPRYVTFSANATARLPQTTTGDPVQDDLALVGAFLNRQRALFRLENPTAELRFFRHGVDDDGFRHLSYTQTYRDIPVWPAQLNVHLAPAGYVAAVDGFSIPTPRRLRTTPVISREQGLALARSRVPDADTVAGSTELILYAYTDNDLRLAWKVRLPVSGTDDWLVVVDAMNGNILMAHNTVTFASVAGSGVDLLGKTQAMNVWQNPANSRYYLIDTSKDMFDPTSTLPEIAKTRGAFFVVDAQNQPPTNQVNAIPQNLVHITSTAPDSGWLAEGVSVASTLNHVYDYYNNVHNWQSFDGKGGTLTAIVRIGRNYANAFMAADIQTMVFGDADNFAVPDIIGHEFQHGVTANTARLVYQDQSGALNEAYSDIFGEMLENYIRNGNDWVVGSELSNPQDVARSLKDPHAFDADPGPAVYPYPAVMSEFLQTQSDHGGVHVNNTIITHAFYLIAAGLPDAIGKAEAQDLFFRALRYHLTPRSQFIDARLACIAAAGEIYADDQARHDAVVAVIKAAFDAVEVTDAPATPSPVEHTPVAGEDAAVFLSYLDPSGWDYYFDYYLARCEANQCVQLSQYPVSQTRPAVSGDGSLAVFVDADNDLCSVPTDGSAWESCLGFAGTVYSVAMSPDGRRWAFVLIDQSTGEPDNAITILEQQSDGNFTDRTIQLQAPVFDGVTIDAVLNADAMDFATDGNLLYYDAVNVLHTPDGRQQAVYSIYALDLRTDRIFGVVPPVAGKDIGYPAVAQTSDRRLIFDVYDSATNQTTVTTADLQSGAMVSGPQVYGWSVPGFNGDDSYMFYTDTDSIYSVPLAGDHVSPQGQPGLELSNATFGVVYRRGAFTAPAAQLAVSPTTVQFAATATGAAAMEMVTVRNAGTADLRLTGMTITGAQAGQFQLAGGNCSAALLPPSGSCGQQLRFVPTAEGPAQAVLEIASDSGTGSLAVPLAGTGLAPQIVTHTITVTSAGSGTVTPSGQVTVAEGASRGFSFTAAAGFHVDQVRVDDVVVSSPGGYTFTNVTAAHTLHVVFAADAVPTHTITVTSAGSGTVTPSGQVAVAEGADQPFFFTPAAGYQVAEVLVDGTAVGSPMGYTFTSVTAPHALHVTFTARSYRRTGDLDGDGGLGLADALAALRLLADQPVSAVDPAASADGDGRIDPADPVFSLQHSAVAAARVWTIEAVAAAGGSIFPAGTVQVGNGAEQLFTILPQTGYHVADVVVDGRSVGARGGYSFPNVTENHRIEASFAQDVTAPVEYRITAGSGAHGAIAPAGIVMVAAGGGQAFSFTADSGYVVADVVVNGQSMGAVNNYQFANIQADQTISVTFKPVNQGGGDDALALFLSEAGGGRYDVEEIIEDALDVAVRAVWTATEQAGVVTFSGTLTQVGNTMNFTYQAGPADKLLVRFSNGNSFEIMADQNNFDGYTKGGVDDFLQSHQVSFAMVSNTGLNISLTSNTWPSDSGDPAYDMPMINWQRHLTGIYPDGSRLVNLDIISQGTLKRSDPSSSFVYSLRHSTVTGTAASGGNTITVNEKNYGSFSHNSQANTESKQFWFNNSSSAVMGGTSYQFTNYQVNWIMAGALNDSQTQPYSVSESGKWSAAGQVTVDGQLYGTIGFSEAPQEFTRGPAVVLNRTAGGSVELFRPIP